MLASVGREPSSAYVAAWKAGPPAWLLGCSQPASLQKLQIVTDGWLRSLATRSFISLMFSVVLDSWRFSSMTAMPSRS